MAAGGARITPVRRRAVALVAVLTLGAACGDDGGGDDAVDGGASGSTAATAEADDPLADGRHFGQVAALDPGQLRLVFDAAELDGDVVEDTDDTMVRLTLDPDVQVRLLDPCCELSDASFDEWLDGFNPDERSFYTTSLSYYWLTVEDERVVAVDEQYIPQ